MDCSCAVGAGDEVWFVGSRVSRRAGGDQYVAEVEGGGFHLNEDLLRPWSWDWLGLFREVGDFGC